HGVHNSTATPVARVASATDRVATPRSCAKGAARQNEIASSAANKIAGGQTDAPIARSNPIVNVAWSSEGRGRSSSNIRTNTARMNGASAKQTSGPISPWKIALRTIGFAAYAIAPVTAGNAETVSGRSRRNTPQVPTASEPPTTSERASPA